MNYVSPTLPCRFCAHPSESPVHLLSCCPGTLNYRYHHRLSLDTLRSDSPIDIIQIAKFDSWISHVLPFDFCPPINTMLSDSLASHIASSTQPATTMTPRGNTEAKREPTRKRPLLIPSSWSHAP
jgi:hypothetical protein